MDSWDNIPESRLPSLAVYNVHDSPVTPDDLLNESKCRAVQTLPTNLSLRPSPMPGTNGDASLGPGCPMGVWSNSDDIIPRGTKFGPMIGVIYRPEDVQPNQDRKYFWRVYENSHTRRRYPSQSQNQSTNTESNNANEQILFYIDGKDTNQSNWMRYVQPAYRSSKQNLVAYQEGTQIYFLTVKHVNPNEELTVWYCREFAQRMNYPLTGEMMLR